MVANEQSIFRVNLGKDHVERFTKGKAAVALAELVWNALDGDAQNVNITVEESDLSVPVRIIVEDDGDAFEYSEARSLFGNLGNSWKKECGVSKRHSRKLHGSEGKGRFRALALGDTARWIVRHEPSGEEFSMEIKSENAAECSVGNAVPLSGQGSGVRVEIENLFAEGEKCDSNDLLPQLLEILALYLMQYPAIKVSLNGQVLKPTEQIASDDFYDLDGDSKLRIIEWKAKIPSERWLCICKLDGTTLIQKRPKIKTGRDFTAYICSRKFDSADGDYHELLEMNPDVSELVEKANEQIKRHFEDLKKQERLDTITGWKQDGIYPYSEEDSEIDGAGLAKRQVFDLVAVNIENRLPSFQEAHKKEKKFHMRLLRQVIEKAPQEIQTVISEVLDLPQSEVNALAKILDNNSLVNIIKTANLIETRLTFLQGLKALVFDHDYNQNLKERSQLHKIIADGNTWIFGDEYNLCVSDKGLTTVLEEHLKNANRGDVSVTGGVLRHDGRSGLVDLMLSASHQLTGINKSTEHLIIELKRPTVHAGEEELSQIKSYAKAVTRDERFASVTATWNFFLVVNDAKPEIKDDMNQENAPRGRVMATDTYKIWVKTWAEIIKEAEDRLAYINDSFKLNISNDEAIKVLAERHAEAMTEELIFPRAKATLI